MGLRARPGVAGRLGRADAGGEGVSHGFPCRQPGALKTLAGPRRDNWGPDRWSWVAGPGVGSFHCSWQLFLGPWQAGLGVLGHRHLSKSRSHAGSGAGARLCTGHGRCACGGREGGCVEGVADGAVCDLKSGCFPSPWGPASSSYSHGGPDITNGRRGGDLGQLGS